ncbi:MAG: hypothetical protein EOO41_01970, partial [Methanobacteriota archaeon]
MQELSAGIHELEELLGFPLSASKHQHAAPTNAVLLPGPSTNTSSLNGGGVRGADSRVVLGCLRKLHQVAQMMQSSSLNMDRVLNDVITLSQLEDDELQLTFQRFNLLHMLRQTWRVHAPCLPQ